MASFDPVADDYDLARPSYPPAVFDALGELGALRTLDIGAGTGIATRELVARGARVVAVDPGNDMLRRAVLRTPGLQAVVADGAQLPVPDSSIDLVTFAQAWHWLDPNRRVAEMHRVLRPEGRWAAWWSQARADSQSWFDTYWTLIEQQCPGTHRGQRDTDWGATIASTGSFTVEPKVIVPWTRELTVDDWINDQASHSYVLALTEESRSLLLTQLRSIVAEAFPGGTMSVPYETWLWLATRA